MASMPRTKTDVRATPADPQPRSQIQATRNGLYAKSQRYGRTTTYMADFPADCLRCQVVPKKPNDIKPRPLRPKVDDSKNKSVDKKGTSNQSVKVFPPSFRQVWNTEVTQTYSRPPRGRPRLWRALPGFMSRCLHCYLVHHILLTHPLYRIRPMLQQLRTARPPKKRTTSQFGFRLLRSASAGR